MSEWSIEAIIALLALITACVPAVLYLWRLINRFTLRQALRTNQNLLDGSLHYDIFGGVDEELGCIPQRAQPRVPGRGDFGGTRAPIWGE